MRTCEVLRVVEKVQRSTPLELAEQGFTAYNAGDTDAVIAILADDFELVALRSLLDGTSYHGPDGFRGFVADMQSEWETWHLAVEEFREVDEESVLVLARFVGRTRTSGVEVDQPAAWFCRARDGAVVQIRAYSERDLAMQDLGLSG